MGIGGRSYQDKGERDYEPVSVSKDNGLPVKVDSRGRVVERERGEKYRGPDKRQDVYTDKEGNIVTKEGGRVMTRVDAYISSDGSLHASNGRYDVVFGEDEHGRLHTVYSPRNQKDGVAQRVAASVAVSGILLGLLGLFPYINGNVIAGQDVIAEWSASALLIIGLLAVLVYLVKSRHSKRSIKSKKVKDKIKSRLR